jgi:heptosyltransferase-2
MSRIQNILLFSFSLIGDTVLSTAVLSPLQKHFPDARISILVGPGASGTLQGDDRLSEIIIYDRRCLHAGIRGKFRLLRELRDRKFDLVVDLRDSFWARFAGGVHWGMPLSRRFTTQYRESHAVDRYLGILRAHGVESRDATPDLNITSEEKQAADIFLSRNDIDDMDMIVGIHPGGNWPYKLWPPERFAALGDLINRNYGAKTLIFAGPDEKSLQRQVVEMMESSPIPVEGVGLREVAALIGQCHLYIGNDTGPMHIAAAMGTPVVAIFGPTDAGRSGPYGKRHVVVSKPIECSPCHPGFRPGGCKRGSCRAMEAVSVEQVAEAVERMLNS